ncbi:MAG TPA: ABC transporter ATP-binding protein/permease [Vineibacter sp.]|nr:ABC transporter ATP-binding protein/permease [Vineibacter sp.]
MDRVRQFFRQAWILATPYFRSEERWQARTLLAIVIGINLFIVYIEVQFNFWYARFYNALERKSWDDFTVELWTFGGLAALFIVASIALFYVDQWLQIRWRRWLTTRFVESWLRDHAYYGIELARSVDNPDQRIADDVRIFIGLGMSLMTGMLSAITTLFSFLFLLWTMSGPLSFTVAGVDVAIPGYLVWVALLYSIAGTWLAHIIGRPLVDIGFQRQRLEADFRFHLVRLRENAEPIAMFRGEASESPALKARFANVVDITWAYVRARTRLYLFSVSYGQAAVIFPYVVAAPRFFSGALQLGQFIQIGEQFRKVQQSLSYVVTAYSDIAELAAVVSRLQGFDKAITAAQADGGIERIEHAPRDLAVERLTLALPDGTTLLEDTAVGFSPGRHTLITGEPGVGKSTLLRALAGLWPWGRGVVKLPAGTRALFLPQRAYLPIASLRAAATYPLPPDAIDDAKIRAALQAVGLAPMATQLDEVAHWAQRLSPGEQQRLAVARAILYRPDWLFLDEATSSVDEATEAALHRALRDELPGTTIVSVGHRTSLRALHDRHLNMLRSAAGRRQLVDAAA